MPCTLGMLQFVGLRNLAPWELVKIHWSLWYDIYCCISFGNFYLISYFVFLHKLRSWHSVSHYKNLLGIRAKKWNSLLPHPTLSPGAFDSSFLVANVFRQHFFGFFWLLYVNLIILWQKGYKCSLKWGSQACCLKWRTVMLWFLNHTKLMNISISYLPQKQVNPLLVIR